MLTGRISKDGSTIIGTGIFFGELGNQLGAIKWTAGGLEEVVGVFPIRSVSDDGNVIVGDRWIGSYPLGQVGVPNFEAFRWTATDGPQGLGSIWGDSYAWGVSGNGAVVVGNYGFGSMLVFRWTQAGGHQSLPSSAAYNRPTAVSADGNLILSVAATGENVLGDAMLWSAGTGVQLLKDYLLAHGVPAAQLNGWRLNEAQGLSPDGRFIAGQGVNSSGLRQMFLIDLRPPPPPVITSLSATTATFGSPFNYIINATNAPEDFDAFPLPGGLSLDEATGIISGMPTSAGRFEVNLAATNAGGSGIAVLTLQIEKASAGVVISNTSQVYTGTAKAVNVTTTPAGLSTVVTYNGVSAAPSAPGTYQVGAEILDTSYQGSASATLEIYTPTLQILTQPVNATVTAGSPATFSVKASGPGVLSYVWRKGNAANASIVGTAATFTIPVTMLADAGTYKVTVSNGTSSVTSVAAKLTVTSSVIVVAPAITQQPASQTVTLNPKKAVSVIFSVTATGTAPLTYQWKRNGVNITGATGSSFTISKVTLADHGAQFQVLVSNSAGQVVSNPATLTVR